MNPVSIIILLLIIAYCAFVIYKQVQKKKQGGCGGNCAGCSGCSSFQVKLVSSVYEKRILHPEWTVSVYIKKGTGYTIRELDRRKTYE